MVFESVVYEHAAQIIGKTPWEVSRSKELVVAAHAAAYNLYRQQAVVVGIDVYNVEAEGYGAVIEPQAGAGIPSFKEHLCATTAEILDLPTLNPDTAGRLPMIIAAARDLQSRLPQAEVLVPCSGPFSLAANLCGLENLLCDVLTEPEVVRRALHKLTVGQAAFCARAAAAGLGVILFESAASPPLVPPDLFRELLLPALQELFQAVAPYGVLPWCIIGGNTAPIAKPMLETGARYVICPVEADQEAFIDEVAGHPEVMVRVNMSPAVFCSSDVRPAIAEAQRVMAIASRRANTCIGSGVLPYEAVPQTVLAVRDFVAAAATASIS